MKMFGRLKRFSKRIVTSFMVAALVVCMCVPAFAAEPSGVAITSEMLTPIIDAITGNVAVIMPIGIAIFGLMIGLGLIPKIIGKFTKR